MSIERAIEIAHEHCHYTRTVNGVVEIGFRYISGCIGGWEPLETDPRALRLQLGY